MTVRVTVWFVSGKPEHPLPAWPGDLRGQPAGHKATRDPSRPDSLAADDASDPQLARPVLLRYWVLLYFIVWPLLVLPPQGRARGQLYRPDSRHQLPSLQLLMSSHYCDRRSQGCPDRVPLRQAI